MKTVYNPGETFRYQFWGIFGDLDRGETVLEDNVASYLQRKYARVGVHIVPTPEEVEDDKKYSDLKIQRRHASPPRPKRGNEIPVKAKQLIPIPERELPISAPTPEPIKEVLAELSQLSHVPEPEVPATVSEPSEEQPKVQPDHGPQES